MDPMRQMGSAQILANPTYSAETSRKSFQPSRTTFLMHLIGRSIWEQENDFSFKQKMI